MWLCNTKEAIEHQKNCKDPSTCDKCHWIDGASEAMCEYGTIIEPELDVHPLYDMVKEKFNGEEVD